jgi:peptidyl-tRNA hydrolase
MVYNIKQYILICPGGWTKGKIAAQVAHASMATILNKADRLNNDTYGENKYGYFFWVNEEIHNWLSGSFAKVTLKVPNKEMLKIGQSHAKIFNVLNAYIEDSGATQKDDYAATLAIGPFDISNKKYKELNSWLSQFKLY